MRPTVLFVSKPVAPPFRDGTQCLVRDLAQHCREHQALVMGVAGQKPAWVEKGRAEVLPIYGQGSGGYAPSLLANARATAWLFSRAQADLWHFVFAPNRRTSSVGRWLMHARRVPVVQTIASPPQTFSGVRRLLFGHRVVAQSEWTRQKIESDASSESALPVLVIPPCVPQMPEPGPERVERARAQLSVPRDAPIFVYPGDLETSGGAQSVECVLEPIVSRVPEAVFVFAYRAKTRAAPELAVRLERRVDPRHARVSGSVEDMPALLAASTAVLFPVDDLRGKVDLPIVLLESMALGVPVIAYAWGPLAELRGVLSVPVYDRVALVDVTVRVALDPTLRRSVGAAEQQAIQAEHRASVVAARYERLYAELLSGWRPT
jgi:glycosyltransferase involved in cell wall biosynthesis